jgi:hypothetical protein
MRKYQYLVLPQCYEAIYSDFLSFTHVPYLLENQRGFSKRGDSPTTFPQQFQLL